MDTKKLNTKLDIKTNVEAKQIKDVKENHLPEKRFSAGAIAVTVWNNVLIDKLGAERSYRTISFERRYLDKATNQWKSSNSLRVNDLPKASLILDRAYEYIVLKHEQISGNRNLSCDQKQDLFLTEKDSGNSLPEDVY